MAVPTALTQYFGYDPGVSYKKRSEASSQAEFDRIVAEEIKSGRPVLYCGQDVTIGHAFVADGYDPATGMIYINWGWGGLANGWFRTTMLNPNASHSYSFNNLVTIVYNIKPGTGDNTMWSPIGQIQPAKMLRNVFCRRRRGRSRNIGSMLREHVLRRRSNPTFRTGCLCLWLCGGKEWTLLRPVLPNIRPCNQAIHTRSTTLSQ